MQYLLLICPDPELAPDDSFEKGCEGWTEEMTRRGVLRDATGLRSPAEARTVRVRAGADQDDDDEVSITDGPFTDAKELIGGLCVIDCEDLDEATGIAAAHPSARYGAIEVRPIWDPTTGDRPY
ncbi:hypothetical protein FB561_5345 [Kribbella amoyensis]|uniref:YCII-related domain-containing protein n=1 Tax=Kribbella amoyensis TaxID=996641 RepID=A0A561BZ76_9ACTN|nr:YciI family protein [Kribbella amoyensis]TWD84170.1 hypothetical protein FB561_5345 [Kribbella amoyensis]